MLRKNFIQEKLNQGETVVGTFNVVPSMHLVDVLCAAGLDFVIVDGEHGPVSTESMQQAIITCESRSVSPVVRVGGVHPPEILKALDGGAHCIQVPNLRSAEQLKALQAAAKYPPLGDKGFSPFVRASNYSSDHAAALPQAANQNVLVAIHVEGKEAIEHIDAILEFDLVDIVFIGMYDLSQALGIPGQVEDQRIQSLLSDLVGKISGAGKVAGSIANTLEQAKRLRDAGLRYIAYSVDCNVVHRAYHQMVQEFKASWT